MAEVVNLVRKCTGRVTSNVLKNISLYKHHLRNSHSQPNQSPGVSARGIDIPEPQLNLKRLCDRKLTSIFDENIKRRKGAGDINRVIQLYNEYQNNKTEASYKKLMAQALSVPNDTHPQACLHGETPKVIKLIGKCPEFSYAPKDFDTLMGYLGIYRDNLSRFAGHRAYYFVGELAELEHALVRFTLNRLLNRGFHFISVPDILRHQIIESCGMATRGERSQVYHLNHEKHFASAADGDLCLSGTAEMALGGYLMNRIFHEKELPLRLVSVSRCYRAETSGGAAESGLYRVHQFTKVEMFGASIENKSEDLLEEFRSFQEENFELLGLHLQVLDMPPNELGSPAYRKYDLEAWLPGRKKFGEVSSCSNCTDYQSRRLNVQYESNRKPEVKNFVHTVNGTACAVPRLVIAICETHQQCDGRIKIPEVLRPFMKGKREISRMRKRMRYGDQARQQFKMWETMSNTDNVKSS